MVDIALDARWGRISEGNGEDPYLSGVMAKKLSPVANTYEVLRLGAGNWAR